jgi:DNA-binding protein H-NS
VRREALEKQIEELRNAERGDAIEWICEQMALFNVKPEDLKPRASRGPRKQSAPVAANYRGPASGATWMRSRQAAQMDCGPESR